MFNFEEKKQKSCPFNLSVPVLLINNNHININNFAILPPIPDHSCRNSEPLSRDLVLFSSRISHRWQDVALQLEIPREIVRQIAAENQNNTNAQCRVMFFVWQDRANSPLCWCIFIKALYCLGLNQVARDAQAYLHSLPPDNNDVV